MKLTDELREKVKNANSKEEVMEIIKNSGMALTDDELSAVSGGAGSGLSLDDVKGMYKQSASAGHCPYCNQGTEIDTVFYGWKFGNVTVDGYYCGRPNCGNIYIVLY